MTLWLSTSSLSCFPHWISACVLMADAGAGKDAVRRHTISRALTKRRMDIFLLSIFTCSCPRLTRFRRAPEADPHPATLENAENGGRSDVRQSAVDHEGRPLYLPLGVAGGMPGVPVGVLLIQHAQPDEPLFLQRGC